MKLLLIPALLLTALVANVSAKDYKLTKEEPVVSFTIPDSWEVTVEDDSIAATSDGEEVLLSFEVYDGADLEGAIEETFKYLKENKVEIDPASQTKKETTFKDMKVAHFGWSGKDEDGATNISLTILGVAENKALLLLYWASPEGEKKHIGDLRTIQQSITKISK